LVTSVEGMARNLWMWGKSWRINVPHVKQGWNRLGQ
jgi:hypothetical protein